MLLRVRDPRSKEGTSRVPTVRFRRLTLHSATGTAQRAIPTMLVGLFMFLVMSVPPAYAHVGSPDVFYEGPIGPYTAHVTIRMPTVVPGKAEIIVRTEVNEPVDVFFCPIYAKAAVTNAPPLDPAALVRGETNLYSGDLWLMTFGAYSIEIKIHGKAGEGAVEIPVNSVALSQMSLPSYLGKLLAVLGGVLFFGGLAIVAGAARDSVLPPGVPVNDKARFKGRIAGTVTFAIFFLALWGGHRWWKVEENVFQSQLHQGYAPDLSANVRVEAGQRILRLNLAKNSSDSDDPLQLLPDHGKLLHFFLIRAGTRDAFAHLHPVRKGDKAFEVALPPLPAGRYDIFCDLTLEKSGMSATATNTVELPEIPRAETGKSEIWAADPDDSWAGGLSAALPGAGRATNLTCGLPGGQQVVWKPHASPHTRQDAGLQFQVLDAAGNPAELEPYMGMMCHAAILRSDGAVFAHLHPAGNYSMAAQNFFESKVAREINVARAKDMSTPMDHSMMRQGLHPMPGSAPIITLPYEFPTPGDYRIWVQFRTGGRVLTAVFDTTVTD